MHVASAEETAASHRAVGRPGLHPCDRDGEWYALDHEARWRRRRDGAPRRGPGRFKPPAFVATALLLALAANGALASTDTTAAESTDTTAAESTDTTEVESTDTTAESTDTTAAESTDTTEVDATTDSTEAPSTDPPPTTAAPGTEQEREQLEAAESAKELELDAANARLGVLTEALAALQQDVETQSAEVDIATRRLLTAEADVTAAEEDVVQLEAMVVELEVGLQDQAIRSFKGEVIDGIAIELGRNPNQAIRMQAMLAKATESDIDYVNELSSVREDLLGRRADAERAAAVAEESRVESEAQLAALEEDQQAQFELAAAAEDRLDHLLTERAALARLGAEYDQGADEAALVQQLAASPQPERQPSTTSINPATITESDIRLAGNGIEVHVSIVEDIRRLLADAAADGVELAGGGYRDSAGQIAARRNNCGTSNYAIYEMPSSQCRPPTARPGRSMHEQGRAIDFTYNGRLIRSRSGPGWEWLQANAAKYGLFNLPSEPWHWSTNGR
ncbi:MAG: D-alanyl-D-alanine carboxypeptidase family protein [Actinomycetota bacterium]